ncbi:MAG: hypothetical protein QF464_20860, partial [Myxococcota bacterium]|nr:hypothetical protein [Myxococcota bacterium]
DPDAIHRSYDAVAWPFPTEHLLGAPDLSAMKDLSATTSAVVDPSDAQLFDAEGRTVQTHVSQWPLPLYAALAMLLLDLLLRRVRLYGSTTVSWHSARG